MARGKHAAKAEARNLDRLEAQVESLSQGLQNYKDELRKAHKEIARLTAIEDVFDSTRDVIAELQRTKQELADVYGRNLVLNERCRNWAQVIMSEANREFALVNRSMIQDIIELGYWTEDLSDNRQQRRSGLTRGSMQKAQNKARADREGWGANG